MNLQKYLFTAFVVVHKVEINQEIRLLGQQTPTLAPHIPFPAQTQPPVQTQPPAQTQPPVQTQLAELILFPTTPKLLSQPNTQLPLRNSYRWISIKVITDSQMTNAGYQDNWKLHIAKMIILGSWVNGKSHGDDNDGKQICFAPYRGREESTKTDFEILSSWDNIFHWYPTSDGNVPSSAVIAGWEPESGEATYICRAFWKQRHFLVGKLKKTFGKCVLPHAGREELTTHYEVLIDNKCGNPGPWIGASAGSIRWVPISETDVSRLTHVGDQVSSKLYIARTKYQEKWIPGHAFFKDGSLRAVISHRGKSHISPDFQVLTWTPGKVIWVGIKGSNIPTGAIIGGHYPPTEEVIYVCRGTYNGYLFPGKAVPSLGGCYFPYMLGEKNVTEYDVLVENTCGT
ncbi:unnamed protein product [Orchesella dallaii]|uniref:Uncharacterized protein n=1 Tax=Orchesella dallaii TaxID=48710 RepID=A0ABP1RI31_9HEXA